MINGTKTYGRVRLRDVVRYCGRIRQKALSPYPKALRNELLVTGKRLRRPSLQQILRLLQINLFERRDLLELLRGDPPQPGISPNQTVLLLS